MKQGNKRASRRTLVSSSNTVALSDLVKDECSAVDSHFSSFCVRSFECADLPAPQKS